MAPQNSTLPHENNIAGLSTPTLASASRQSNFRKDGNDDVQRDIKSISNQSINIQVRAKITIFGE